MISFQCSACGASIPVKSGNAFAQCEYCDSVSAVPNELLNIKIAKHFDATNAACGTTISIEALMSGEYAKNLMEKMKTPPMEGRVFYYQQSGAFQNKMNALLGTYEFNLEGDGYPIIMYDDTLRSNGKNGFVLTSKKLFFRELGTALVVLNLSAVTNIFLKKGLFHKQIMFESQGAVHGVTVSMVQPPEDVFNVVNHIFSDYKQNAFGTQSG